MSDVKGVVEAKSNKYDKYSILVNGNWYSSKYEIKCEKGDTVDFDDGGKKYVNKLRVVGAVAGPSASTGSVLRSGPPARFSPGSFPIPVDTSERAIVRQNALTAASAMVTSIMLPSEQARIAALGKTGVDTWEDREKQLERIAEAVVGVARIFENYTSGDGDMEAATASLKNDI